MIAPWEQVYVYTLYLIPYIVPFVLQVHVADWVFYT